MLPAITAAATSKGQIAKQVGVYIGPAVGTPSLTGTGGTTTGSASIVLTAAIAVVPGMLITGPGIPPGAFVGAYNSGTETVTLANGVLATATAAGVAVSFYTFIDIGEANEATPSGRKWATKDSTSFATTGDDTFLTGTRTPGQFKLAGIRVDTDPGQQALSAAHESGTMTMFAVQLPINTAAGQSTVGDIYLFNGLVEEFDPSVIKINEEVMFAATVKINGSRTYIAGA